MRQTLQIAAELLSIQNRKGVIKINKRFTLSGDDKHPSWTNLIMKIYDTISTSVFGILLI